MSILTVTDLTQGFGEKELFHNISFRLSNGEHIGLVGDNGQGKSTFIKIITGEILPDDGNIEWSKKVSVGYMDQNVQLNTYPTVKAVMASAFEELFSIEQQLNKIYENMAVLADKELDKAYEQSAQLQDILNNSDFYSLESVINGIMAGVGIKDLADSNPQQLSGGQRTKVLLAKLLLEKPDILLLDEPTNHLDEENIQWLQDYLANYANAFILISHDTKFMNAVVNTIYHLANKTLTRYPGNYEKFLSLKEEKELQIQSQYTKQQGEVKKLQQYIDKNKVRASTAAMAKSKEKKLDKMVLIQIDKKAPAPHFNFQFSHNPGKIIFKTTDLVVGYDTPLTKPLNITMERNEKIAIIGANGIGKTTLLKSLLSLLQPLHGSVKLDDNVEIAYYEQEIKTITEETALDNVYNQFPTLKITEVRKMMAHCGLTSTHINTPFNRLSGGEQAKVRLCKIMNKKSNLLILDEPTNHLDVKAKAELKRALIKYEGTILLVSHEPDFYNDIATDIWNCQALKA